jgi:predicted transposase YbfD/YdcC
VFEAFLDDPGTDGPGVLATSGKTLRRSFDRAAGRAPLHVVTGRRCTDRPGLPGLAMIACVPSGRQIGESTARRFHVSPARLTSKAVAKAAGTRWLIGNSPYRVLDVAFDEDRARNRKDNGAETLSLLRKLTLNLLRNARRKLPVSRQTQTRRMVRRPRKIHHRPNAMALHQPTARVAANGTEG